MRRLFLQLTAYDTVADRFDSVQMVNAASEGWVALDICVIDDDDRCLKTL